MQTSIQTSIIHKMRRHKRGSGTKHTGRVPHKRHHHENQRVRVEERALEQARCDKGVQTQDRPMPLLDIGEGRINELIRSVTDGNEDAFQDVWVSILEGNCQTEEDILAKAREAKKHTCIHNYPERSLQKPLTYDSDKPLTLEDTISSPELQPDDTGYRRLGKPQGSATHLDDETKDKLRERFGNFPLGRAIRSLVGLPPKENKEAWQGWEDDIIKECYSWGGTVAVIASGVKRKATSINWRASKLGIKRGTTRPKDDWLTPTEVATIFHCRNTTIYEWCGNGSLNHLVYKAEKRKFVFITKVQLVEFMQEHPFMYPHERMTGSFRQYIPHMLSEYISIKEAAEKFHYSLGGIYHQINNGMIPCIRGYGRKKYYIKLQNLEAYLNNPIPIFEKLHNKDWKLHRGFNGIIHLIRPDDEGWWWRVCGSGGYKAVYSPDWEKYGFVFEFAKGNPTCKKCLEILRVSTKGAKV